MKKFDRFIKLIFTHGLGGIVVKENQNEHEIISNINFNSNNFKTNFTDVIDDIKDKSITVKDCLYIRYSKRNDFD